ncbi:MAG: hypothetical protein F4155_01225 [Acidimicrobiales bacterium]|nr:hypothetical protein [Acidimicrobiales bacterium]
MQPNTLVTGLRSPSAHSAYPRIRPCRRMLQVHEASLLRATTGETGSGYAGAMSRRADVLERHRAAILDAARRNNASSIALAGSAARGTDHDESDCDFVCTFAPGTPLLDMAGLQVELVDILGCKVDVSSAKALKPPYDSMLDDAISL